MRFKDKIEKLKKFFSIFIMPFSVLLLFVSTVTKLLEIQIKFINPNFIFYTAILLVFLTFFQWFNKLTEYNTIKKVIIEFSYVIFIMNLFLITILNLNFLKNNITSNSINLTLTIIVIFTGFILMYINKDTSGNPTEVETEKKRYEEFPSKFLRINKIPLINNLFRWIYKEGLAYSLSLIIILLVAISLRLWNLTILDPYTDEYFHLVGAKDLLETGHTLYTRAFLVTYLVKVFYSIGHANSFYEYILWGRLPGVIFGAITIIPLYLLAKKINKPIAIISAILLAISPWAIGLSRNIREYAFYPFFILIACLILTNLVENIFNYKKENKLKILTYSLSIMALSFYAYRIDSLSTLKIIFVVFPAITLYFLIKNFNKIVGLFKIYKKIFLIISILLLILLSLLLKIFLNNNSFIININFQKAWFDYFFNPNNPPMQWWHNTNYNYIATLLFVVSIIYAFLNRKKKYFLYLLIFLFVLTFFTFLFSRYSRPRYISYELFFFIIIISTGVYSLIKSRIFFVTNSAKLIYTVSLTLFLFNFLNLNNTVYSVTSDKHGYVKMTNENHDKVGDTILFLKNEIQPEDVFITTIFGSVIQLAFNIDKEKNNNYDYKNPERFKLVEEVIKSNKQGFMILDSRRNGDWATGYPKSGTFNIGTIPVTILQNKDGIQVYRWKYN